MDTLYYESHVTVEPVFDAKLELLTQIAHNHKFRVADLFLQKRPQDTPERSRFDSFCTSRGQECNELVYRTRRLVADLQFNGLTVWRYKVESALVDERFAKTPAAALRSAQDEPPPLKTSYSPTELL